jgi:hypothetical protein
MYISFICFKYNIIHVYSHKYIQRMQSINYFNLFNYRRRIIQFDVVLYLHVPGILQKKYLCVSINCNCFNSIIAKTS